jgi:D-arabinose 5-phosphate isomerase GutQ/beta-phosphoglucomutase-like phosphatase (HAD superfamily)/GTP:adenosylcobinamide-phosphate guanylyltransferase
MIFNLYIFDLYIFDLDGTLINTEKLHYESYKESLNYFNYNKEFTYNDYCKLIHYDDELFKTIIATDLNLNYKKFYQHKKDLYISKINSELHLNNNVEILLNNLFEKKIKTAIVTHSEKDIINIILEKLPILKKINIILSRDDYNNKKPHPECYIKVLDYFPECKNPIGFEDSYKGFLSLNRSPITSVLICSKDYYYCNKLNATNFISDFCEFDENKIKIKENISNWIDNKINKYSNSINDLKETFKIPLTNLISLFENMNHNIYLTGIGKCGHICKKSVSTWQSMGISCHYLNLPDLFHGDFGILKENDIIIYISNSGNTKELINCASYIKQKFKILQIALTINKNNEITNHVNFCYSISNTIEEIDKINMAPTLSSVIFMIFLDMLGVYLAEKKEITLEKFQLNHPGGDLGKKSKNIIDYVTIIASGQGTRLFPFTKYIPKILVNFKNKPFVKYLIEYWQNYAKNIIIVYNKEYESIIKFYCEPYKNITLIHFNELTGTADTINKSLTNEFYNKNILFTWCDILPDQEFNISNLHKTTIVTYGNECRYIAKQNKIEKNKEGNIIGIYYIKNYNGIKKYTIGDDICDVFSKNFGDFDTYELNNLIDIGDMPKLNKYIDNNLDNNFQTRFFNKITFNDDYIIKEAVDDQGREIIKKEINWYKNINNTFNFIPLFNEINDYQFKLKKLNAVPLYTQFDKLSLEEKNSCLSKIYDNLKQLHSNKITISTESIINDITFESYTKIINRLNMIKPIINYFDVKYVNGIKICDINSILNKMKSILLNNLPTNYSLIHGDCQFSNILYSNNDVYFIDPRGYFGKTLLYGDSDYDYAKVLYAITGYDQFNNNDLFSIELENQNLIFQIKNYLNQKIDVKMNDRVKAWLVVIWFGLAQYNSNNILKCIASYYNGFYWYNYFFSSTLILDCI